MHITSSISTPDIEKNRPLPIPLHTANWTTIHQISRAMRDIAFQNRAHIISTRPEHTRPRDDGIRLADGTVRVKWQIVSLALFWIIDPVQLSKNLTAEDIELEACMFAFGVVGLYKETHGHRVDLSIPD